MADEEDDNTQQPLYEDDEPEGSIFRWMSALVVLLAVAGFFGLAWYAYRNGGDTVDEKDVELVKADKAPVKEAPANPGGMQIPNQDKTVYGLISGKTDKPVVERILPAPEEPIARGGDTETWMSESLKSKASSETAPASLTPDAAASGSGGDGSPAAIKEQFNPAKLRAAAPAAAVTAPAATITTTPAAPVTPAPVQVATSTSAKALPVIPPASSAPVAPPATTAAPATTSATKVPETKTPDSSADSDDDDDTKTADAKPPAPPAAVPPAGNRVQLGAYKSQGEAESNWTKIAHKFSDEVKSKQHYVVKADLGSKGVFYRLQLAPFSTSGDAEQFCLDFVSAGQGCIATKGK